MAQISMPAKPPQISHYIDEYVFFLIKKKGENRTMCCFSIYLYPHRIVNMYVIIELERSIFVYMQRSDDDESRLCINTIHTYIC